MNPIKSPFWHILQRAIADRKALGKPPTQKTKIIVDADV